ncbi:hypothetical protein K501DRAFT_9292 [Backusella circina FSU 941]|nr:hypothetical protein K501DRAFT_9292 [Backusella circina FSU 941]
MRQLPTLECLGIVFPILNHIGQGLTHLSILSSMIIDISTTRRISFLLKSVPNLRSFVIKSNLNNPRPKLTITLEDVEAIHHLLPNLENLQISGDSIQMPLDFNKTAMNQISAVPICSRIRNIHMNTIFTSAMWLFYVAHKYPNVKELIIGVHFNADDTVMYNHTEFYTTLVKKCKQLLHLQLDCSNISDWMNSHFFEVLGQTCVRKVQPIVQSNNYINNDSEFDIALQYGGRLITALEIAQWRLNKSLPATISSLKNLLHLNYLELKCDSYNDIYEMNNLLESCSMLETLVLEWGTLCITDSPSEKYRHHPLSNIRITYIAFDISFFTTLSKYCPRLSKIIISRCKQLYNTNDMASKSIIKLYMPTLTLDYVLINGLRLDSSNASAFYHGLSSYVRIISVEDTRSHSKEEWYHHIGYKENDRKIPRLERIKDEEQNAICDYFEKRKDMDLAHSRDEHLEAFGKQVKDNILKTNIMFGYVQLRCKSLGSFVLDGNINCMFFFT